MSAAVPRERLEAVLRRVNALRYRSEPSPEWSAAEEMLAALFRTPDHLAVYGTLAPGAPNHHHLAGLRGEWRRGWVRGDLHRTGWGAVEGYPSIRWNPGSDPVPVHLLVSADLERHWERLDGFEGPGYQRILVPVCADAEVIAVANIYEGRERAGVGRAV